MTGEIDRVWACTTQTAAGGAAIHRTLDFPLYGIETKPPMMKVSLVCFQQENLNVPVKAAIAVGKKS